MSVALITGSSGLIGSEAAVFFGELGYDVVGIDNDMRKAFFGPDGSTGWNRTRVEQALGSRYVHEGIDIRGFADRLALFKLGVSWGGHESLIVPGEVVLQQKAEPNSAVAFGIHPRSVRLHVGLEGTEALWSDLEAAITVATSNEKT